MHHPRKLADPLNAETTRLAIRYPLLCNARVRLCIRKAYELAQIHFVGILQRNVRLRAKASTIGDNLSQTKMNSAVAVVRPGAAACSRKRPSILPVVSKVRDLAPGRCQPPLKSSMRPLSHRRQGNHSARPAHRPGRSIWCSASAATARTPHSLTLIRRPVGSSPTRARGHRCDVGKVVYARRAGPRGKLREQ
jgi:hypothetical protein